MVCGTKSFNTRGTKFCMLYGEQVIAQLTAEDTALLQSDPNFCEENTISALCERYEEQELTRGDWEMDAETYGISLAHISICIRENMEQTLASLVFRLAYEKKVLFAEAARVLVQVYREKGLFYYEPVGKRMEWTPGTENSLIDAIAKKKRKQENRKKEADNMQKFLMQTMRQFRACLKNKYCTKEKIVRK